MNLKKRTLALLLSMLVLFTLAGCANKETNATNLASSHQWTETEVTPFKDSFLPQDFRRCEDGSIVCVGTDEAQIVFYRSANVGTTWTQEAVGWRMPEEQIRSITLSSKGAALITTQSGQKNALWYLQPDKDVVSVVLPATEELKRFMNVHFIGDTTFSVTGLSPDDALPQTDYALSLSTEGTLAEWGKGKGASSFGYSSNGKALFFISENGKLQTLDDAGKTKDAAQSLVSGSVQAGMADENGNYYFIGASGISRIASGGNIIETMLPISGTALDSPNVVAQAVCFVKDAFLCLTSSTTDGKSDIFKYELHAGERKDTGDSLIVWSLYDLPTVRMAITEYNKKNPKQQAKYNVATQDGTTANDALKVLNTQLLAQSGPDVLLLDGVDTDAYIQKGLLSDLSAISLAMIAKTEPT